MSYDGDAHEYDRIAEEVFAPAFPAIAKLILEKYGRKDGKCLDIGSGGGHLGFAMLNLSQVEMVFLDNKPDALELADRRIIDRHLEKRASTLLGDATNVPAPDATYDLAISRGSLWFWGDQKKGLAEAWRVLKPGGMAFIGGGFGDESLKDQIVKQMRSRDPGWDGFQKNLRKGNPHEGFAPMLHEIGIDHPEILDNQGGFWIIFKKE